MAKAKEAEVEVLTPEIIEHIDKEIVVALTAENVTDKLLEELEINYSGLTIKGQDDKEGYLAADEARKNCKKVRVLIEKTCKLGRAKANAEAKRWIAKEDELSARVSKIEDDLAAQVKEYDAEKQRVRDAEVALKRERQVLRTQELTRFGAQFEAGNWVLNDVSYEDALILGCDDDLYGEMRDQYKAIFDENERVRVEKEIKEQKERDDIAKMKQEIRNSRIVVLKELFGSSRMAGFGVSIEPNLLEELLQADSEQWQFQLKALTIKKESHEVEENRIIAEKNREDEMKKARFEPRKAELLAMGFTQYNGVDFSLEDTWSTYWEQVFNMSDEEWPEYIKDIQGAIDRRKVRLADEEKKRLADLGTARLEGIGKGRREMLKVLNGDAGISDRELGSIEDEKWKQDYATAKFLYEKKQKELADQAEKDRQELLNEKQKYSELCRQLSEVHRFEFRSGQYRAKARIIYDFIDGLKEGK